MLPHKQIHNYQQWTWMRREKSERVRFVHKKKKIKTKQNKTRVTRSGERFTEYKKYKIEN